jgi:hypothetical protein
MDRLEHSATLQDGSWIITQDHLPDIGGSAQLFDPMVPPNRRVSIES